MTHEPEVPQFESALETLQIKVRQLESGELSLEQGLLAFEEGVKLIRICQAHLVGAEQRVEQLTHLKSDGSPDLQPFKPGRG